MKIAISGFSGCGNTTVSAKTANLLGAKAINYTLRNLAKDIGLGFEEILEKRKEDAKYDYMLDRKQLELAGSAGNVVLGSRLACWLLEADLKVWLNASLDVRSQRIAQRESTVVEEVLDRTRRRDVEDAAQYQRLYGVDIRNYAEVADLVLNTEVFNADQVAEKIVEAANKGESGKKTLYPEKIRKIISEKLAGG